MPKAKVDAPALFEEGEIGPAPDRLLTDAKDAWNAHAKAIENWPRVTILDDTRSAKLKKAIRTSGGLVGWRAMLGEAAKSDVLTGRAAWCKGSKWFNFDWLIKPANLVKVLEGNYKNAEAEPLSFAQQMKGIGVKTRYAEPPKPFVAEHPDVRDAAAIISWRKIERYDKANEVEERLAKRQGRPAVLVPAPEVAREGLPSRSAPTARKPAPTITDVPDWTAEEVPMASYADMVPE